MSNVIFPPSLTISVSVMTSPQNVPMPNINTVALFTTDQPSWVPGQTYAIYQNGSTDVATDFGSSSKAASIAAAFFAQSPNPVNSGGYLCIIPRQIATGGTKASLVVQDITYTALLAGATGNNIKIAYTDTVEAGLEVATVAGAVITVAIDTGETTATQVKAALDANPAVAKLVTYSITGTGSNAQVTATATPLANGSISGGTFETVQVALARVIAANQPFFFGVLVDEEYSGSPTTLTTLATYVQGISKILIYASSATADFGGSGMFNTVQGATETQTRCLYYNDGIAIDTPAFAAAYAAKLFSTDFSGSLQAQTMNLKQLVGFTADNTLNSSLLALAATAGVDVYVNQGGLIGLLTSGSNGYSDQIYNQFWLQWALQYAGLNFLAQTGTKIPQTESGMVALKNAYGRVCQQAVQNGFAAPGAWNSSTTFGPAGALPRCIQDVGYYIYSLPVANQSTQDRAARKAPLVQIALKCAGAIHSSTVIVEVNP